MSETERAVRVLLIEDNAADARLLQEHLSGARTPFEIRRASALTEGLDLLARNRFDVVVLDLFLPDSQELDTLRAVTSRHPDVPVVVLTGLDEETLGARAVQTGAQDFIAKDRLLDLQVADTLRFAVERHRLRRALERSITRARTSELKFRNVFEGCGDGLVILDRRGRILSANPRAEELLETPAEELVGTEFPSVLRLGEAVVHDLGVGASRRRVETLITRMIWSGRRAYLASVRDVTERARAEARSLEPVRAETILLAEREADVRGRLCSLFEEKGYAVLSASSAREAMTVAGAYEGMIDFLVTDVAMADATGLELAERLREVSPQTTVCFLSGLAERARTGDLVVRGEAEVPSGESAGDPPPSPPAELLRTVNEMIGTSATSGGARPSRARRPESP